MQENEIILICGKNYKEMTKALLEKAELSSRIPKNAKIGIKPNLVTPTPASYGATTHPELVAGIIEYLQEHGFSNISILEGSWIGDKTQEAFEYCGYRQLESKYGVPLLDMQKDKGIVKDCAGMDLSICSAALDIDFLINVPVMKGHCQTKMTCALKNLKGLIPNSEKRRFHRLNLHEPIAHLNTALHQDFILVDHICGDLDFEEGGNPVSCDCLMAALDPVLTDAYAASLMGYSLQDIPYIALAQELNVGTADLNLLKLTVLSGDAPKSLASNQRLLDVSYAVNDADSCSACYGTLIPALSRLQEEGLLEKLSDPISIGQGFQGKNGILGTGACTKNFLHSIPGCPPKEEVVYEYLKKYILEKNRSFS